MIKKPLEEIDDDIIREIQFKNKGLAHLNLSGHKLKRINKFENIPTLTNLNISNNNLYDEMFYSNRESLHGIENILYLQELDCSNNNISSLDDLETIPNIIIKLSLKGNPLINLYNKSQYHELIQTKFPNLKYLDDELFIHQNYSYSLLNNNPANNKDCEYISKNKLNQYDEMVKKIDEFKSKIESLEEIIKIQNANTNTSTLLDKWREKVYQLLIHNKINEKLKNRELNNLKAENMKLKNENEKMKKDIKKSIEMFYHSFSDIYRQIMMSSDNLITKCNSKVYQLTEIIDIKINPIFERISTENDGFEETIHNLIEENENLKAHINQCQIEIDNISQNYIIKEKELNNQIDRINENYRTEKSVSREASKMNEELENRISKLESDNIALKNKIDKISIEKQSLDLKVIDYEKKIEKLTKENKDLLREGIRLTSLFNKNNSKKENEETNKENEENESNDGNNKDCVNCLSSSSSDSSSDSDDYSYSLTNKKRIHYDDSLRKVIKQKKESTNNPQNKDLSLEEQLNVINKMKKAMKK